MYPGYLALGLGDPFAGGTWYEIINNGRAYAYADRAGIGWLEVCATCPDTDTIVPGSPRDGYVSPVLDPAPWYDPDNPDSWGFYGVVGVDVDGADSSTRTATVTETTTGGGVIGPANARPRTLVVRAVLVAADECSLQFGINWLREQTSRDVSACVGESVTFFDCCPCICEGSAAGGPCWPRTYGELAAEPSCDPDWWPQTYLELLTGPPTASEDWCAWIERYFQLRQGPTDYFCCVNQCVVPYLRQYHNTMVTEGPTILSHPVMHTTGAMAEVELTITAADPVEYALATTVGAAAVVGGVPYSTPELPVRPDPFGVALPSALALAARPRIVAPVGGWLRHTQSTSMSTFGTVMLAQRLTLRIRNGATQAERVRVGVWDGDERVAGWLIPFVPSFATLTIDGARRTVRAEFDGRTRELGSFVRDWDGGAARFPDLPHGGYTITVDQESGSAVPMIVVASATPVGAP